MAVEKRFVRYDDFAQLAQAEPEQRFELIDGEIVAVSPSYPHGRVAGVLHGEMYVAWKQTGAGRLLIEVRFKLPDDDHNAMIPDLSYVVDTTGMPTDSSPVPRMPDLAVEIQSPDDRLTTLRKKAAYYIANGTRLVWLVLLEKRQIEVYCPGENVVVLTEDDTLDGGDVLPGFSLRVRDIFA